MGYDYIYFDNKEKYNMSFLIQISTEKNININDILNKDIFLKLDLESLIFILRILTQILLLI